MTNTNNTNVVLDFFDIRFTDPHAAREMVALDATWIIPGSIPYSGTYRGRESIFCDYLEKHARELANEFESITSKISRVITEGGCVVVEYLARARTTKGREYETVYYFVIDLKDGKIQSVRLSFDTLYTKEVIYDDGSA